MKSLFGYSMIGFDLGIMMVLDPSDLSWWQLAGIGGLFCFGLSCVIDGKLQELKDEIINRIEELEERKIMRIGELDEDEE